MRITTNPSDAQVFVQGRIVRGEDSNRTLAKRIDRKKERGATLSEKEANFEKVRDVIQGTPLDYEFPSVGCGYGIRIQKKGYEPLYRVEYIRPRWYEMVPIDLIVDILPFTVTDLREFNYDLTPQGSGSPFISDATPEY